MTAAPRRSPPLPTTLLLATGCGTAVASVCAVGLVAICRLAPGLWAALCVLCGGALAFALSRCFARLATTLPSSAGFFAYLARGFSRRAALALALPYLLLSLFLVGAEATLVGRLITPWTGLPAAPLAFAFLLFTWALCRRGIALGLRAQALSTWALLAGLSLLALAACARAAVAGQLATRLWLPAPPPAQLLAAVGQALFLFMGFELITSQADLATPCSLRRALSGSSLLLTAFYALLALGIACLDTPLWTHDRGSPIPQIALSESLAATAQQASAAHLALPLALAAGVAITLLSLLASYTSFNGALITLGRLAAALASQGTLPRTWAQLDGKTLLPARALRALLTFCLLSTALVLTGDLLLPSILAAAPAAALLYAAIAWVRARPPFAAPPLSLSRRAPFIVLALLLAALAVAVVVSLFFDDATHRTETLLLLLAAYGTTAALLVRTPVRAPARPAPRSVIPASPGESHAHATHPIAPSV